MPEKNVYLAAGKRNVLNISVSLICSMVLFKSIVSLLRASLVAQLVNNLPAMPETPVRFLDQEDPLKKR